ncbi:MAG: hypothetical protein WBO10_11760 [Pyrinomonadaceae bacterium]
MFNRTLTIVFLAGLFCVAAFAQPKTEIKSAKAAKMLLGKHMFSLQWISWDYFGTARVTKLGGLYTIRGEQKGRGNTDFVSIVGDMMSISEKEFVLDGTVTTQVSHINGGKPCERSGELTFKITGKRKYWRLQEIDNPCDAVADYVDIFFR